MFNEILGVDSLPKNAKVFYREAVRAVIKTNNRKILLVHNSNGDYKFPGGGIEKKETHYEALYREVLEEIGVKIKSNIKCIGSVTEQRPDIKEVGSFFVMKSFYYECQVDEFTNTKNLDEYEKNLEFKMEELDIDSAYDNNFKILKSKSNHSSWLKRETLVLDKIRKKYL